tara:strand:- start:3309 stop:4412 length:1104 start_codon:yes stop_codon:yes gene_type:complete
MVKQLVLWGPPIIPSGPSDSAYESDVASWVKQAADVGITKMIPGSSDAVLVKEGHKKNISVHPYVNYTAFPSYGMRPRSWGWSLEFLRINPEDPAAREIIDNHRAIYDAPPGGNVGEEKLEPFANDNPHFWSLNRDKSLTLAPGERRCMSLAFPEVRTNQIQKFIDALDDSGGGDGIQVELVLGNEDDDRIATYGYEDAVTEAFTQATGKNAFDLPNGDIDWLKFRANYVTEFLKELREAVKSRYPQALFTSTMIAGDKEDYIKVLQDWPEWIEQGIVDELYVWWRTDSDIERLERQVKYVSSVVNGRCPFIAELSCYHPGSFQTPEKMITGARTAIDNGADGIGIYRSHGVAQLNYWPVLEEMSKL